MTKAQENPGLDEIWRSRETNQRAYELAASQLVEEYQAEQTRLAESALATTDRDAVASAVRGANLSRPTADPPPDFSRMSNAEFERWKSEDMRP